MKKQFIFTAVVVVVILAGVGYFLMTGPKSVTQQAAATQENQNSNPSVQSSVKTFTIVGANFSFTPNQITVNKGDNVKIIFVDSDGVHNLVIDGYNAATPTINSGGTSEINFVADKTGSFSFYCSVDSHRERGMVGTLIVQ